MTTHLSFTPQFAPVAKDTAMPVLMVHEYVPQPREVSFLMIIATFNGPYRVAPTLRPLAIACQGGEPLPDNILPMPNEHQAGFPATPPKVLNVLVVDDNEMNLRTAQCIFKRAGQNCDTVDNGAGALEMLTARAYDLVLMDIHMPDVSGVEVTARIRKSPAVVRQPRILAWTTDCSYTGTEALSASGMDGFLPKPVRYVHVRDLVATMTD
jgi:CheY-like chemotaxis protein